MKKFFFFLFTLICFTPNVFAVETKIVTLGKCVDGDTATFIVDGVSTKFRFIAINTPESVTPNKAVEAYGKDASSYTCNILTNAKEILIEYDGLAVEDDYGRKLAWIWADKVLLQKSLVEVGYAEVAYVYDEYRYANNLCVVQQKAKESKVGIWSDDKRKEGYCSNIDTDLLTGEISFEKINVEDESEIDIDEEKFKDAFNDFGENIEKYSESAKKITNTLEKATDYINKNETGITNFLTIAFVIAAVGYLLAKMRKK